MHGVRDITRYGVWASHLGLLESETARAEARRMGELGFGALWVGEAEGKEALTHAAFLLGATEHVVLATGIANIWGRDARAMVNGARTLAEGWPERFLLGIGASHAPLVEARGGRFGRPYSAMIDYLDAMEEAPWRGPELSEEPPLVLAALGPKMLELAAGRADGAHTFLVPVEHTRRAREIMGDAALLAPEQATVLADDREDARRSAERHLRNYLRLPNYRRNLERLGFDEDDMTDGASDRLFDALIAWGDPEAVATRVREHLDAGADHVAVHPLAPSADIPPSQQLEVLAPHLVGGGGS
jgi:probable F420-dependent oxidoreductase